MSEKKALDDLMTYIPGAVHLYMMDEKFTILQDSAGFQMMFGYSGEEISIIFHNHYLEMIYEDDRNFVASEIRRQLEEGDTIAVDYRIRKKNGNVAWVFDQGRLADGEAGRSIMYSLLSDITEERADREELRLSLERNKFIMDQAEDVIFEWDIRRDSMVYSSNWHKKFGYEPIHEDVLQRLPDTENIHPDDSPLFVKLLDDLKSGVPFGEAEVRIRDAAGYETCSRIRARLQKDAQGRPIKAIGLISDISEDRKAGQELYEQSQRDILTGLLKKKAVRQKVDEFISVRSKLPGVMLLINLDHFKKINTTYGHLYGDALLSDLSGELRKIFRSDDVVGRIGGDEFLVYLPAVSLQNMERRLPQIHERLRSVSIAGSREMVSCSIGVSCYPVNGTSFSKLYQCADKALSYVKKYERGRFAFYTDDIGAEIYQTEPMEAYDGINLDAGDESFFDQIEQYSFRMLYEAVDIGAALKRLIEIIGRAYEISRIYIFENSDDGGNYGNTLEWCNSGIRPQVVSLQNISVDDMVSYRKYFNENGIFYCNQTENLETRLKAASGVFGTKLLLQCAILDQGSFRGFIGFDECRENRTWSKDQADSLGRIGKVLATFLMKQRLREKLEHEMIEQSKTGHLRDAEIS